MRMAPGKTNDKTRHCQKIYSILIAREFDCRYNFLIVTALSRGLVISDSTNCHLSDTLVSGHGLQRDKRQVMP